MKKILIGFVTDLSHSGIDKYLLGVTEILNENGIYPDFLTSEYSEEAAKYFSERNMRLFRIPSLKRPFAQYSAVKKIIKEGNYDTVYLNISEPLNVISAFSAKKAGVKNVFIHSHSSGVDRDHFLSRCVRGFFNFIGRKFTAKNATAIFACSEKASDFVFGKKHEAKIIYNAIDLEKFAFDEKKRDDARRELGLTDEFTVTFVGNMCYQKDPEFALEVFEKVAGKKKSALVMVGIGEKTVGLEKKSALSSNGRVIFTGVRNDVDRILCASDAFILPSRFEGLGIVLIEAQASGLYTFASDRVPRIAKISDRIEFLPKRASLWAKKLGSVADKERSGAGLLPESENFGKEKHKAEIKEVFGIK